MLGGRLSPCSHHHLTCEAEAVPPMPPLHIPISGSKERKGICPPVAEDVQTLVTFEAIGWSFTLGKMLPLLLAWI